MTTEKTKCKDRCDCSTFVEHKEKNKLNGVRKEAFVMENPKRIIVINKQEPEKTIWTRAEIINEYLEDKYKDKCKSFKEEFIPAEKVKELREIYIKLAQEKWNIRACLDFELETEMDMEAREKSRDKEYDKDIKKFTGIFGEDI